MTRAVQLTLDLAGPASFAREDFVVGEANRSALGWIDRWPDWPGRGLVLYGPEGAGKSHLASLWLERSGGRRLAGPSGPTDAEFPVLIEDLAAPLDETALLHLYNRLVAAGQSLLVTARRPPASWPLALPDLRSRMLALPTVALAPPDDALLRAVLQKLFGDRQLRVGDRVLDYLLARMDRSYATARALVAAIDRAALAGRRDIALPLVAAVLAEQRSI